jgi:PucR C-terminal helix-turn-helix domain
LITWMRALASTPGVEIEPASSPSVIADAQSRVGTSATAWVVEAVARICVDLNSVPDTESIAYPTDLRLGQAERQGFESCLLTVLCALAHDIPATEVEVPQEAIDQVRLRMRQGTPLDVVLRTLWATQSRAQDALLTVMEDNVPLQSLGAEMRNLNNKLFAYADVIVRALAQNFEDERSMWQGRISAARRRIIDTIVAGGDVPHDAEDVLGLRLQHHHMVAVHRRTARGYTPERETAISGVVRTIARRLEATSALALEVPADLTVVIWSFAAAPPMGHSALIVDADLPSESTLSVGVVSPGAAGLRESYFTAMEADSVARLQAGANRRVWSFDAVRLQALLLGDDAERAERYTRRVLHGLVGNETKAVGLRETLRHYLLAGRSRQAAAEVLHLAPTTVAYRVGRAEEMLGRASTDSVLEIQVALELAHAFPRFVE